MHPTDSPALLDFRQASERGEACTLASALRGGPGRFPVVQYASAAFSPRAWQNCWLRTRRARIQAFAKTGRRSGPLAWEVSDLYTRRDSVTEAWDLLEQLAAAAGRAGALRLFIRVRSSSPCFDQARRAGYVPVTSETVYQAGDAQVALRKLGVAKEPMGLRPRTDEDFHGLFRLYSASTPLGIRSHTGQTMSEWRQSQEKPPAKAREWILENGGGIAGWVRAADARIGRWFSVTWGKEASEHLSGLVAAGLEDTAADRAAVTMVPAYAEPLAAVLEEIGFEPIGRYDVLVRLTAERVTEARGAIAVTS